MPYSVLMAVVWVFMFSFFCASAVHDDTSRSSVRNVHDRLVRKEGFGHPNGAYTETEVTESWKNLDVSLEKGTECIVDAIYMFAHVHGYRSLSDYGAGIGSFALYFKGRGIPEVHCFDANPVIENTSKGLCHQVDLGTLQPSMPKVDLAMSLEVGEHIPKESEDAFLSNIDSADSRALVISWAHPGQGGIRHVNEQPHWYIADRLRERGFKLDRKWTSTIRNAAHACSGKWWFQQNTMAFTRSRSDDHFLASWSDWMWLMVQNSYDYYTTDWR